MYDIIIICTSILNSTWLKNEGVEFSSVFILYLKTQRNYIEYM